MHNKSNIIHLFLITLTVMTIVILSACGSKHDSPIEPNLPKFEQKFPQKSIWVHHGENDSTELTFSSMEEAEWKLLHITHGFDFLDAFEKILLSDPSSLDYSFDSLFQNENLRELYPPVKSDDGNMRCFREYPSSGHAVPSMIVQYRIKNEVRVAEEVFPSDNCFYCLAPDTVFAFNIGESTLYLVSGYIGYTGDGHCYGLMAYEIDATDFHPAFVFPTDTTFSDYLWEQHALYMEICFNADTVSGKDLFYFDKDKSTIYVREIANKEMVEECGCITKITNRYRKYAWNGKEFVDRGAVYKK